MASVAEELNLWRRYRAENCRLAREEIFFRYAPWARSVARDVYRRLPVPQVEWADYAHNATIGLLEAMSRFDASRGIDFMGYAKARVRGAVFNGLRSYLTEYKRRDSGTRMGDRMDSFDHGPAEDVLEQVITSVAGLGLGFLLDSAASSSAFQMDDDPGLVTERQQMDQLIEVAMLNLPEKERQVMVLHYHQHVPFVEIAGLLGVTKGRVSQIHKAAIGRMRASIHAPDLGRGV